MLTIENVPESVNPVNTSTSQRAVATSNEKSCSTISNITRTVPIKYVIAPMQRHKLPPIHNYTSEDYNRQQLQRMTSTSEEEEKKHKITAKMNGQ